MTYLPIDEETVDDVAISLHRHHEARRKGPWPNMWTKYADLDGKYRNEYRERAAEVVMALQGAETIEEATTYLAALWCSHGPALARYTVYARERINETLSDVPTLKETK